LALEARLLFDGALRGRNRFESLIGNRLTALDREAIGAAEKTPLGTLDGGEPVPEIIGLPLAELLLVQLRPGVRHLVLPRELFPARKPKLDERLLDAPAFAPKKLPCSFGLHLQEVSQAKASRLNPAARGRSVRLVQVHEASTESQLRERGEIGRLLASATGYRVLDEARRPFGRLDHVRYERHADHPDEIVARRGLLRRRHILPFEAVAAVDGKNETVLLRIKP
jgi:hypothetical protein